MIVCLCRGVSHRKLLNVVESGAQSVAEVTRRCGAGGDCGACRGAIAQLIATRTDEGDGRAAIPCAQPPAPVDAAA